MKSTKEPKPSGTRRAKHEHQQNKRVAAAIRQVARNLRSDEAQLDMLIARGQGHCQEALKLEARISGPKQDRKERRARARRS